MSPASAKTKPLNPTLWRTCRVLSGQVRLSLLQRILQEPGQNVSRLAEGIPIGISAASQELRRLQSRGLLRRSCHGTAVVYLPAPDPQVPAAAPLLAALKTVLTGRTADPSRVAALAKGLGHEKRVELVQILQGQGPRTAKELAATLRTSLANLSKHLRILNDGGWVQKTGRQYALRPATTPLMSTFLDFL